LFLQTRTSRINTASKMSLLAWEQETGIRLVQVNGQRRYGGPPPGWVGDPPPASTEVFIGKLPQDMYEDTLIPLFGSVGRLYEFRLMMTFSGLNRGFAYARYSSELEASKAISTFHHFQVRRGCTIKVCWSTQKCELVMDGLAASTSQQKLEAMLQTVTEDILCITLHASLFQRGAKLAVLKYRSHKAAAMAKKALMEVNLGLGEAVPMVYWLDPMLRRKLSRCEEEPSPSSSPVYEGRSLAVPRPVALPPSQQNVMENMSTPLFLSKRVQVDPDGCQRFWNQVVIPGGPEPIAGFVWVLQGSQGQRQDEEAKVAEALHFLQLPGESL
ncbi:DND1 protein, partial [Malurus elegans]|nr:DND1 protein [Malurus elegans]